MIWKTGAFLAGLDIGYEIEVESAYLMSYYNYNNGIPYC